ncbi:MAG: hypothetical protein ACI9JK_001061, partial [Phycisphaerales bacterium]
RKLLRRKLLARKPLRKRLLARQLSVDVNKPTSHTFMDHTSKRPFYRVVSSFEKILAYRQFYVIM